MNQYPIYLFKRMPIRNQNAHDPIDYVLDLYIQDFLHS